MDIKIVYNDGREENVECEDFNVDDGVLKVKIVNTIFEFYPLHSIRKFIVVSNDGSLEE